MEAYFRDIASHLETKLQMPQWASHLVAGASIIPIATIVQLSHLFIAVLTSFLPAIGGVVFSVLDDVRKAIDPEVAGLSVSVLNELLGTDLTADQISTQGGISAHLARAETVGGLFHSQLMSEFAATNTITPESGVKAARRFTGLAINFGTATGIIATLGGLAPFIHLDDVREIGEQVATNLGLGRLQRLALQPLIQILLAEPYKWYINNLARPTQFKLADVVNPFTGSIMDPKLIWQSLAWEGYSDDKITALLELHRKKLAETDYFYLFTHGLVEDADVLAYLKRLGYTDNDAQNRKEVEFLKAQDPYQKEIVAAATAAYAEGHIQRDELQGIVNSAVHLDNERSIVMLVADYKKRVPTKHLTLAQVESAYEQGVIDLSEFNTWLSTQGYSQDDQQTLQLLTLLKLKKLEEAAKAKEAKAAATAAKQAAKSAASTTPTGA
jgi:hypothetical protein